MSLSPLQFGDLMPKLEKRHGEDFSDVVNTLAHGTLGDPDAESIWDPESLPLSRGRVLVSDLHAPEPIRSTFNDYDTRTKSAASGYKSNPASVPPVLLVKRAGGYEIADGHHRIAAARSIGKKSLPAWVVHSPLSEPHPGFDD
jgi:hypothetical protein